MLIIWNNLNFGNFVNNSEDPTVSLHITKFRLSVQHHKEKTATINTKLKFLKKYYLEIKKFTYLIGWRKRIHLYPKK